MADDVVITDRTRFVLSWGVLVSLILTVALAVETRVAVANNTREIGEIKGDAKTQASQSATRADIDRIEQRVIRIESLLLQQQPHSTGR